MEFLVVGLGNPGSEYDKTRHNVGFCVIDLLAERNGVTLSKETSSSQAVTANIDGHKIMLAKPTTYMNDSGIAVGEILRRYKLEPEKLIVVHDELDLEFGDVRIKIGGGLAGHNGLRSIKSHIKTQEFIRVRIGVGKPNHKTQGANHVLKQMTKKQFEEMEFAIQKAADAVEIIIKDSLNAAMQTIHTM